MNYRACLTTSIISIFFRNITTVSHYKVPKFYAEKRDTKNQSTSQLTINQIYFSR